MNQNTEKKADYGTRQLTPDCVEVKAPLGPPIRGEERIKLRRKKLIPGQVSEPPPRFGGQGGKIYEN
jgi:hypothetical protein